MTCMLAGLLGRAALPRAALLLSIAGALWAGAGAPAHAQSQPLDPAFARSGFGAMAAEVTAGEPFDVTFVVANDGEPTTYTRAVVDLPTDVLLARRLEACGASFDAERRVIVLEGALAAGEERRCALSLLALPRRSTQASLALRLFTPPDRYAGDVRVVQIATPPAPAVARVGGVGVTAAGLAVTCWVVLLAGALALGAMRRGRGRFGAPVAVAISLGFLAYFAWMAWDDARVLMSFPEAACEVIDTTASVELHRGSGAGRHDSLSYAPHVAVRFDSPAGPVTAVGFSTASRLRYRRDDLEAVLSAMGTGRRVPCWYDAADPRRVVLVRGFGGAHAFALVPAMLLAVVVVLSRRRSH